MHDTSLSWLPAEPKWPETTKAALSIADRGAAWRELVRLANTSVEMMRTARLDLMLQRLFPEGTAAEAVGKPVRVALLGASTLAHLHAGIRVGFLRRNIQSAVYEVGYGQYVQELYDPNSGLASFRPTVVVFALDARHISAGIEAAATPEEADQLVASTVEQLQAHWEAARGAFQCAVIQQTFLPVFTPTLGNNEYRLGQSRQDFIRKLNVALRTAALRGGVDLLAVDEIAAADGIRVWHDPSLWCEGKLEITPLVGHRYGEHLARLVAAQQGRSYKCLVLDLDNTLWGGVIGDDGLEGITLGQGSALGEGFIELQNYALSQARRGIILAVVSKNDEENAKQPFRSHPEMKLKLDDIACFIANWDDKATNIKRVAAELNIGIDSLVFVDDNPFERNLVRQELPMVAVPEVPENPAYIPRLLGEAGYFEATAFTREDAQRTQLYRENSQRTELMARSTDMATYLRNLDMEMIWKPFDRIDLTRVFQLINKTNQFNLTTRRYTEEELETLIADTSAITLQLRLTDRFGDNGIIGLVIARSAPERMMDIDTWLMSCRVLGRGVEEATLNLLAECARRFDARGLIGRYIPTKKNGMVAEHYQKLGFTLASRSDDGATESRLDLDRFAPFETSIRTVRG